MIDRRIDAAARRAQEAVDARVAGDLKSVARRLTPSQREALAVLGKHSDAGVITSNQNGPTYIASGSAEVLERRGLAISLSGRRHYQTYRITAVGRRVLEELT